MELRNIGLVVSCKLAFIIYEYGCESDLPNNFCLKSSISNFKNGCEALYRIQGNAHLRPYVN
jgi:hypothetical protein